MNYNLVYKRLNNSTNKKNITREESLKCFYDHLIIIDIAYPRQVIFTWEGLNLANARNQAEFTA